jgi:hypothetical protein
MLLSTLDVPVVFLALATFVPVVPSSLLRRSRCFQGNTHLSYMHKTVSEVPFRLDMIAVVVALAVAGRLGVIGPLWVNAFAAPTRKEALSLHV